MMRGRSSDGSQKKRLITTFCLVAIFFGFLYVYHGSIFGYNTGTSALQYGSKSLRKLGLGGDDEADAKQEDSSTKFTQDDLDDGLAPKSFPYYDRLVRGRGLLISDQLLMTGSNMAAVQKNTLDDGGTKFKRDFSKAMVKLSNISPLARSKFKFESGVRESSTFFINFDFSIGFSHYVFSIIVIDKTV